MVDQSMGLERRMHDVCFEYLGLEFKYITVGLSDEEDSYVCQTNQRR